jgi:nicotinamidase/pyrazinamidase
MKPEPTDILLATDVQNDFCEGGALAVPDGAAVVEPINRLSRIFPHVAATQDWHPKGHLSFASRHPGKKPFETIPVAYGEQTLWPDHCVQGSFGAEFHPRLKLEHCELILRKGFHAEIDSYSAFVENDRKTATGFAGYLRERGFQRLFLAGLATDFCVLYSALDARVQGFNAVLIEDACRAIDLEGSYAKALRAMREAGVVIVQSRDIAA